MEKKTIGLMLAIVIIVISVFVSLSTILPTLDQSNPIVATLTEYFGLGTVLLVVAFMRNILGFLTEYVKSQYKETFEDQKLYSTIMYYLGLTAFLGTLPVALLPEPWGTYVSAGIIILLTIVDLCRQAFNLLWGR